MTSIGITSVRKSGVTPATRLRLTARGRRVLTGAAALPIVVAIAFGAISGGSALASREEGAPAGSFAEITVMAGESLWSIAQDIAPAADPRDVVDEIVRLNALDGVVLSAGQRLAIPSAYAAAP
jgi:Tfp pilus assembly protein FimV